MAEPPPDEAPEGVCRTWSRLWQEEHGTGYVPSRFCYGDGVDLRAQLESDQVDLVEPAMRAFITAKATRGKGLNEFCRVASGLIAVEVKKRRSGAMKQPQSSGAAWAPAEDRPIFDATRLPPQLRVIAANVGLSGSVAGP